jgi:hypothetical protein
MKEQAKKQLGQILGTYDEKLAEVERIDAANRAAQAAFPGRFATLRTHTIRPVLEEFVEVLNGRGHQATAREQEESSSTVGGVLSAAIALRIIPRPFVQKSTDTNKSFIEVTFSANRNERKITVSSTNTMTASIGNLGKRGEYELDAVTADVVAEHVLQILQEALSPAR